jgi:hypothetical protein
MDNSISIFFGTPVYGWLPVDFRYNNFHLEFDASDALNDPIEDLYNAITKLGNNEYKQVTWWLEPGAYFFNIEKLGQSIHLTITETDDLYGENPDKTVLQIVTGDSKQIIEPFRNALKKFCSQTYDKSHWPNNLDRHKNSKFISE